MIFQDQFQVPISNIYHQLLLDLSNTNCLVTHFQYFIQLHFLLMFNGQIPIIFSQEISCSGKKKKKIQGVCLGNSQAWSSLKALNRITGEFPDSITEMFPLQGPVPNRISKLANLQILDLSSNNLTGSVPAALGNLLRKIDTLTTFLLISDIPTFAQYAAIIVNWKRSVQSLSSTSIDIYSSLDLSKNQFRAKFQLH